MGVVLQETSIAGGARGTRLAGLYSRIHSAQTTCSDRGPDMAGCDSDSLLRVDVIPLCLLNVSVYFISLVSLPLHHLQR